MYALIDTGEFFSSTNAEGRHMAHEFSLGPIGPSTGWLFAKLPSWPVSIHWLLAKNAGAPALEIAASKKERLQALLGDDSVFPSFSYVSIHLGSFRDLSIEETPERHELLEAHRRICQRYGVRAAAAHPDTLPDHALALLRHYGVPLAIENMDRNKKEGRTPQEFQQLARYHASLYVLDIQHAYEISRDQGGDGIDVAVQLAKVMEAAGGVAHLHVSGEITLQGKQVLNHAPVHLATNRRTIIQSVRAVLARIPRAVPIIGEGDYLLDLPENFSPRYEDDQPKMIERAADNIRQERECLYNELG